MKKILLIVGLVIVSALASGTFTYFKLSKVVSRTEVVTVHDKETEVSVLKEQKDCDRQGGTFYLDEIYPENDNGYYVQVPKTGITIKCTAPDVFNYKIKLVY